MTEQTTKNMLVTLGAGIAKKAMITLSAAAVSHGVISSNQTETFVSAGMLMVGLAWSLWNDYGRAIVLSQLDVLKAKSLAQAAKLRENDIRPVTAQQIAAQSPTMTTAEVEKVVEKLPAEVKANIAPMPPSAAVLAIMVLAGLLLVSIDATPAAAQARKPQITGNIVDDTKANLGLGGQSTPASKGLNDILGALDDKLLPDLQYALKIATASGSKITAPCYQSWIDIIQARKASVTNPDGTAMDLPSPRLITDFEKAVELRNALQPDSDFMLRCSPVANMIKQDMISFIGKVLAGGAGLATLIPGL